MYYAHGTFYLWDLHHYNFGMYFLLIILVTIILHWATLGFWLFLILILLPIPAGDRWSEK